MGFKTATVAERETAISARTKRGLAYVRGDIEIFTPIDGDNQIRIVPPLAEDKHASLWGLEVWTYYLNNRSFLSSRTLTDEGSDPIAEHFFKIRQAEPEEAKKYRGAKRHLMFILDLNDDTETLKLWSAPPTLVDEFVRLSRNRRTGQLIPLEDPKEGRPIFFTKTGTGLGTKYTGVEVDSNVFELNEGLANELTTFEKLLDIPNRETLQEALEAIQNDNTTNNEEYQPRRRESERRAPEETATDSINERKIPTSRFKETPQNTEAVPHHTHEAQPAVTEEQADTKPTEVIDAVDDIKERVRLKLQQRRQS